MFSLVTAEDPRGQAIFDGPVRIQGMSLTVQAVANVVVAPVGAGKALVIRIILMGVAQAVSLHQ